MTTVVLPEATRKAPEPLRLVQRFVNSVDLEGGIEELSSASALRDWLRARDLIAPRERVTPSDLRRAIDVREAFRSLLETNHGAPINPAAVERLDRAAVRAQLALRFRSDGRAHLEPGASGVDAALGRLIAMAQEAMTNGTWTRLKACRSDTCRWAFYDHSKNRSGSWCVMGVCGNREKVRSYRRRHKEDAR